MPFHDQEKEPPPIPHLHPKKNRKKTENQGNTPPPEDQAATLLQVCSKRKHKKHPPTNPPMQRRHEENPQNGRSPVKAPGQEKAFPSLPFPSIPERPNRGPSSLPSCVGVFRERVVVKKKKNFENAKQRALPSSFENQCGSE